jgi:hypothetical protein
MRRFANSLTKKAPYKETAGVWGGRASDAMEISAPAVC